MILKVKEFLIFNNSRPNGVIKQRSVGPNFVGLAVELVQLLPYSFGETEVAYSDDSGCIFLDEIVEEFLALEMMNEFHVSEMSPSAVRQANAILDLLVVPGVGPRH